MKTIDEILKMFPDTKAKNWHQHPNGGGWVLDTADVSPTAYIGPDALIHGNACVSDNAWVYGNACVSGNAQVCGGVIKGKLISIAGPKHDMNICTPGVLRIGCIKEPLEWWLENYKEIGEEEQYTPQEIEEYKAYIDIFYKYHRDDILPLED